MDLIFIGHPYCEVVKFISGWGWRSVTAFVKRGMETICFHKRRRNLFTQIITDSGIWALLHRVTGGRTQEREAAKLQQPKSKFRTIKRFCLQRGVPLRWDGELLGWNPSKSKCENENFIDRSTLKFYVTNIQPKSYIEIGLWILHWNF